MNRKLLAVIAVLLLTGAIAGLIIYLSFFGDNLQSKGLYIEKSNIDGRHIVEINGSKIDISDCTLKDFIDATGFKLTDTGEITSDLSPFAYFYGKGYGADPSSSPKVFVMLSKDGELVKDHPTDPEEFSNYEVTGIYAGDQFMTKNEKKLVCFFGDLHVGMKRNQVEKAQGTGEAFKEHNELLDNYYFYQDIAAILIVEYEDDKVEGVFLLKKR